MPALVTSMEQKVMLWLRQGISPRRLALTLALGFAIGCIPVVGLPTVLCAALALTLRLNLPAIQAANYAAMPFQLLLIAPFLRLGAWIFAAGNQPGPSAADLLRLSPLPLAMQCAALAVHAVVAWLFLAVPAVAVMTLAFIPLLRRVPALAENPTLG
jgi:uncharacterized protein (DUF2062 family)